MKKKLQGKNILLLGLEINGKMSFVGRNNHHLATILKLINLGVKRFGNK